MENAHTDGQWLSRRLAVPMDGTSSTNSASSNRDTDIDMLEAEVITISSSTSPGPPSLPLSVCSFCSAGKRGANVLHKACDWHVICGLTVECTNCANHRANGATDHVCEVPGKGQTWRRYADSDPIVYGPARCDGCSQGQGKQQNVLCDVDPILRYACSRCRGKPCSINQIQMDKRPPITANERHWIRR